MSFGAEASRPSRSNASSKVCWLGQFACHCHATVGSIVNSSSDFAHVSLYVHVRGLHGGYVDKGI